MSISAYVPSDVVGFVNSQTEIVGNFFSLSISDLPAKKAFIAFYSHSQWMDMLVV